MHDTRWSVLETIRAQGNATVTSIAEVLPISAISVRHHLSSLQADGLIKIELERQHVGRPRHVYSLTQAAQSHFPNNYHMLAERLLDELKASLPPEQVRLIIDRMAAHVAARYGTTHADGTLEERLQHLVGILGEEGFMAEVQHVGGETVLMAMNCPYLYVSQRHPEICRIDHSIIESILGVDVEQTSCVLHGDRSCAFSVKESAS